VTKRCVCDPNTWPNGVDPAICDYYTPITDNEDWCICGHDKECHTDTSNEDTK
jgi:hypothetical protein